MPVPLKSDWVIKKESKSFRDINAQNLCGMWPVEHDQFVDSLLTSTLCGEHSGQYYCAGGKIK